MIGWYDARTSLLSYVVAMSRERKLFRCLMPFCGVTGRSLGGKLHWRPSCSPPTGQCSCFMLPVGAGRGTGQG